MQGDALRTQTHLQACWHDSFPEAVPYRGVHTLRELPGVTARWLLTQLLLAEPLWMTSTTVSPRCCCINCMRNAPGTEADRDLQLWNRDSYSCTYTLPFLLRKIKVLLFTQLRSLKQSLSQSEQAARLCCVLPGPLSRTVPGQRMGSLRPGSASCHRAMS